MPWLQKATDNPFGFLPFGPNPRISPYEKDSAAAAIYEGDHVVMESDGAIAVGAASSTQTLGVAAEYSAVSTAKSGFLVYDDPDQLFIIQDDSDTTALTAGDIGSNADVITYAAGSTLTGRSILELDSSTVATGATLMLKIVRQHPIEGQSFASSASDTGKQRKWIVMFNSHLYRDTVGQTGV